MKYYFIYLRETKDIYAYTDSKTIFKNFKETRDMSLFYVKVISMENDDIKELFEDDRNWSLLINFKFKCGTNEFYLPITMMEKQTIEHAGIQTQLVTTYISASNVSPSIFSKKIRMMLEIIGYSKAYGMYHNGCGEDDIFRADYFSFFLEYFGNTIKLLKDKGGE